MTQSFELKIIKPQESKKINVLWIDIDGIGGSFVVGPDHSPIVSMLKPKGRIVYKTEQNLEVEMDVFGGIFHFSNNQAVIVLDD